MTGAPVERLEGDADDFPTHFPGAWQNLPPEVQRYITCKLLERQLLLHNGAVGLLQWLYRGSDRSNGRVAWVAAVDEIWPLVIEDTRKWIAWRQAHKRDRASDVTMGG